MSSIQKHNFKHKDDQPRQKRFKVGKACFTCRLKKIKCDGLQPCMQCKARSRPCSFSKDGQDDGEDTLSTPSPPPLSQPQPQPAKKANIATTVDVTMATELLNKLEKLIYEPCIDQYKVKLKSTIEVKPTEEPSITLPTKSMQQQLIQLYFKHAYPIFPMISKRLFFKQSINKSNILINMMFAHGSMFHQDKQDGSVYFNNAKSLLTTELTNPNLSTIMALILMSLYDQCSTMYASIAFQLCLDLNLMRNYGGHHNEEQSTSDMIELKKRIVWSCYYIDKIYNIQSGKPFLLKSKDIELDLPLLQPGDDIVEHEILEGFNTIIKLLQISERILQPASIQQMGQPTTFDNNYANELLHWSRTLPSHLQWSMDTPCGNAILCQLHLVYNLILYHHKNNNAVAIVTNLIQLTSTLSQHAMWIFNSTWLCNILFESTIEAFKHKNTALVQQSITTLKQLLVLYQHHNRITTKITLFLKNTLDQVLTNVSFEDDIMTPFVISSLNSKVDDIERQQWSKLDYFANGLVTPPTVKSKNAIFYATTPHHSAISDYHHLFHHNNNMTPYNNNSVSWQQRNNNNTSSSSQQQQQQSKLMSADMFTHNNSNNSNDSASNSNNDMLYTLLSEDNNRNSTTSNTTSATPNRQYHFPTYMNVGLGIYASAHQHHNDVIRQHLPTSNHSTILTHQGQVIVTNPSNHQNQ